MAAVTIFGVPWSDLTLERVRSYLEEADDEPLLWEAKGTALDAGQVRREVCAFANSHEGGYLILGASRPKPQPLDAGGGRWVLDGVPFPDEPRTWVTNVLTDQHRGVRPRPDFDVEAWGAPNGNVAVVRVWPTSTPPCLANGTVYERLPGKAQTVRDPQVLAGLFARGDAARVEAEARAARVARSMLSDWLGGKAGVFRTDWTPPSGREPDLEEKIDHVSFAVGVAATGNPPNISGRLFREELVNEVFAELGSRPSGVPHPVATHVPDIPLVSQDALTWRTQTSGFAHSITIVRASWDGAVSIGRKLAADDVQVDTLAESYIAPEWRYAEEFLVGRLRGFGDVYVCVHVAGGGIGRGRTAAYIEMQRGPLLPGADVGHVESLGRELMRGLGRLASEP